MTNELLIACMCLIIRY